MIQVIARKDENINVLLSRFKYECIKNEISKQIKKKEAYYPPSVIKHERNCKRKHLLKLEKSKKEKEDLLYKQGIVKK